METNRLNGSHLAVFVLGLFVAVLNWGHIGVGLRKLKRGR